MFLDPFFLGIYVVELAIKLYALRRYFFKDAWNWFGQFALNVTYLLTYLLTAQVPPDIEWRRNNNILCFILIIQKDNLQSPILQQE